VIEFTFLILAIICFALCRGDKTSLFILAVTALGNIAEVLINFASIPGVGFYVTLGTLAFVQIVAIADHRQTSKTGFYNIVLLLMALLVITGAGMEYPTHSSMFYDNFVIILSSLNVAQYLVIAGFSDEFRRILADFSRLVRVHLHDPTGSDFLGDDQKLSGKIPK